MVQKSCIHIMIQVAILILGEEQHTQTMNTKRNPTMENLVSYNQRLLKCGSVQRKQIVHNNIKILL